MALTANGLRLMEDMEDGGVVSVTPSGAAFLAIPCHGAWTFHSVHMSTVRSLRDLCILATPTDTYSIPDLPTAGRIRVRYRSRDRWISTHDAEDWTVLALSAEGRVHLNQSRGPWKSGYPRRRA